ncbi:Kelch repeat protein [Paenibacillus sp. FSL R7-269]|uniref:hypothetical protein n=1 Tax=Paenibacillus sp. FSL R7-269 TaxID=1226755 RepID=UPI0003E24EEB|nr:hypothetical protein [Paenibacillus sp. FSL R7-269]ETT33946.1 Kelch repeat protein [Paenibacillus sp. FSL R7-269]
MKKIVFSIFLLLAILVSTVSAEANTVKYVSINTMGNVIQKVFPVGDSGTIAEIIFYDKDGVEIKTLTNLQITKNISVGYDTGSIYPYYAKVTISEGSLLSSLYLYNSTMGGVANVGAFSDVSMIPTVPTPSTTPEPTPIATPTPGIPNGDHALLTIELTTGAEKEYDLPMSEINAFLTWYDSSNGSVRYGINKHDNNKGPFNKRTEYVIHDKILTFEVSEYTAQ